MIAKKAKRHQYSYWIEINRRWFSKWQNVYESAKKRQLLENYGNYSSCFRKGKEYLGFQRSKYTMELIQSIQSIQIDHWRCIAHIYIYYCIYLLYVPIYILLIHSTTNNRHPDCVSLKLIEAADQKLKPKGFCWLWQWRAQRQFAKQIRAHTKLLYAACNKYIQIYNYWEITAAIVQFWRWILL